MYGTGDCSAISRVFSSLSRMRRSGATCSTLCQSTSFVPPTFGMDATALAGWMQKRERPTTFAPHSINVSVQDGTRETSLGRLSNGTDWLIATRRHCPRTYAKMSGATIVASDSMMNFGVSTPSFPHVIFSFGTAPE